MAARATVRGLSAADLDQIREAIAAGRRPKVVFTESAGQMAGQIGQVVRLDDPAHNSDWIVVRFGRDELPFAPTDLAIPPKAVPARRGEAGRDATAAPAPREEPSVSKSMPTSTSQSPTPQAGTASTPQRGSSKAATSEATDSPKATKPKTGKPKAVPSLTVTLAYADHEWTISAHQGAKTLAKPYVIRPAEALRMVSMVDVPAVHEAVEAIIAAERAEAESRAERLRAELADIEARLSELTERA